jgi:hypothetical protein
MALTPKLMSLKGDISARIKGSTGPYKPFLNAVSASIAINVTTIKQKSNGNVPGTLAEDDTDTEVTFEAALQSRHKENVQLFLRTNVLERVAGTDLPFTLPIGVVGDIVDLGKNGISNAEFGAKVAGVDYALLAKTGQITYLTDFPMSVPGTFDYAAYTEHGLVSAGAQELELLYTNEKSGDTLVMYSVKMSPAATYALIDDGAAYASSTLKGTLLINPNAPTDGNLGQYGRLRVAS